MSMQPNPSQPPSFVVAGYVRRSSWMQRDNFSSDAQKRAMIDECARRGLPAPVFYEDDELSARSEQIAKRKRFKELLEDVAERRIQMVMVHSLDRWSRNVMVTLQSFRILAEQHTAFISLSEHIDYSTPEGRLQLTILAAFASYFSDMLAKHTSKGKGERAAQGLPNGSSVPFGYRRTGKKSPPEPDPENFPGLRMMGEMRMQGTEAQKIADTMNTAGYRTGGKITKHGLFTKANIDYILHNEFYAPYTPEDDRGTIIHNSQRYRGLHPAAFTYEEWQRIQAGARINYHAPRRAERARNVYDFAGYISDIQCGLTLRCTTTTREKHRYYYYRDAARERQLPCPAGGYLSVSVGKVCQQFGELLRGLNLPEHWRDEIRQRMLEEAKLAGQDKDEHEREKERLRLKRARILKQHRDGYIDDAEMAAEIASVELLLRRLEAPEVGGVRLDQVIAAGEELPGMAALWTMATTEERREMVVRLLEPGGLYYDLELKMIAALKPRPVFLPTLRMIEGVIQYKEATAMLVVSVWQQTNQRS